MLPGITAMLRPGHTPGHTNWLIQSGGERILIWGDIVHLAAVQLARPEARLIYDVDTDLAAATRQKVLEWAADERLIVAGAHLGFPGLRPRRARRRALHHQGRVSGMTILITGASGAVGIADHSPSGEARREDSRADLEGSSGREL